MTLIEIRPHRWDWKVFEAPGVQPMFLSQQQAIDYATCNRPTGRDKQFIATFRFPTQRSGRRFHKGYKDDS